MGVDGICHTVALATLALWLDDHLASYELSLVLGNPEFTRVF